MIPANRTYLTPEEGWRLLYDPEAEALLLRGHLSKWNEPLLALITIYVVHRFEGGIEFHDFKFRKNDGRRIVVSVAFTAEWAQITQVVEEDSIEAI